MDPVTINYGELFQGVVNQVMTSITETLPVVIPILGIMTAIGLGTKLFKRFAGVK